MKKSLSMIAISLFIGGCVTATKEAPTKEVTTKSLLEDMTNRELVATFPSDSFKCKQFSSYSRRAVSPDNGWFSNWDWSNFLRIEKNDGRTEYVMYDHEGPSSVVRFWMTFAKGSHNGYLRFYIDGAKTPVIEGKATDVLSGGKVAAAPLGSSSSELTTPNKRGHNLYMPIPYSKSCKITIETPTLKGKMDDANHVEGSFVYYNINYREYDKNIDVKSFTKEDLKTNAELIAQVNETLLKPMPEQSLNETTFAKTVKAGKTKSFELNGEKAIKKFSVKLAAKDWNQALRSTVLAVEFDDKETIWVPVGDFFGTGYKISPYKSWYTEVLEDGTMSCSWVMPFKDECEISFINYGEQDVKVSATIGTEACNWTNDSLYFHSSWFEKNRVKTVAHDGHTGEGAEDVNFITLEGKGVLVGDSLTLFNEANGTGNKWWGEGDEKIFVDGEKFPSHFGTGTEDYYGYAWCRPAKFHTPFITQPDGSGNKAPGFTVNSRYRLLDQIPFTKSFKFDMELWHWRETYINYAPAVFYYATADTKSNAVKEIKSVKEKVILHPADFFPSKAPSLRNNKIEGEAMLVRSFSKGKVRKQGGFDSWSKGEQIRWINAPENGNLVLSFQSNKKVRGQLNLTYTMAGNYGIFDIYFNGIKIAENMDFYSTKLASKTLTYDNTIVQKGENRLKIVSKGKNTTSKGNLFGLDLVELK